MPFGLFFLAMGVQLSAVIGLYWWIAPNVFTKEVANPWSIVVCTLLLGIPFSLFEYLYHRYLLHSAVLPFISSMHRAHSTHHGLTYVKAAVTPNDPAKLVPVKSEYPIEHAHQEESMMFPLWSPPIFIAVFLVVLGFPLKWLLPNQPILISLMIGVAIYLVLYEVWHAILHLPYEKFWKPLMEAKWSRRLFRRLYSFHLMHHWRPTSNLAVVGFWGVAVWDHVFLTHRRPERIPVNGSQVNYEDAELRKPLWPISQFDKWQGSWYKTSRSIEKFLAKVFLRRS